VVPPDTFTLQPGDWIGIEITGIGLLQNTVAVV
jgi:2-keto-4-pentenoate hydratase/2-oxohepta-3-ene-1,7-dioic acid hydratase in catechol pathway